MSKRYPGGILRKTPQTPTQTSAQGIWDMASVTQAVKENNWPIAGVPDPISRSLRFRSSASAYLNRTFSTPTNSTKWTWSGWFKLGYASTYYTIFDGGSPDTRFGRDPSTNQLYVNNDTTNFIITTPVYRDYSAWYHAVLAFDSSQGTASNRLRLYINGSEVTAFATDNRSSISGAIGINTATAHGIGRQPSGGSAYFDGYMAEINFVDGQQLTPSSFGSTNDQTGVWQPIAYTGTYGTNGFYLPFSNTASTTTLGYDFSGNSNNWTTNNISLTSGSTYDSMVDVPTQWIPYNTAGDTGALFRGNYAVINPLIYRYSTANSTFSNGNLTITGLNTGVSYFQLASIAIPSSSSKFYWENTLGTTSLGVYVGITQYSNFQSGNWDAWYDTINGVVYKGASSFASVSTAASGDIVGIAYDSTANTCAFYKNNTLLTTVTGITAAEQVPLMCTRQASVINLNFGQQPFAYTPPSGFVTLNTRNLTTPTIGATASTTANKYFDATTYTGTGSTQNITNSGSMQPDFVWIKNRSSTNSHQLTDSVRGVNLALASDLTIAEFTGNINAFNANGFQLTGATNAVNASGQTYVGWQWRASNATAVTNTAGSITSTVSANTSAGFSIVTYTGTGANATVGHGLGIAPKMVIVKNRTDASGWRVYNANLTSAAYVVYLNATNAQTLEAIAFNSTAPTSSVFSVGASGDTNGNGKSEVAYCFAEIAGYSAFGSYTGNGSSDGTFVFTGFRPRFLMIKRTDTGGTDWVLLDSSRDPTNVVDQYLAANLSDAEAVYANDKVDFLSNGFKQRGTASGQNASGGTFIYMAFAEVPFKYSLGR